MQKSIRQDLSIRIGLVILCTSLIFGASYYAYSIRSHEKEFNNSIEQQTKHIFNTLTVQLWLFDLITARELCELISESPNVSGLRLLDHKKEVIFERDVSPKEVTIHINQELRHDGEKLVGYVDIYFSSTSWEQQRRNILFVGTLMVLGTILGAFIFINVLLRRYLSKPLEDLQKDMAQLSRGDFQQSILVGQKTEIQNIIDAFNELAIKLQKRDTALRDSKILLDRSQEIAHIGSWSMDFKKNKLIWSDEAYRIFGLSPKDFEPTYEAFLKTIHPDDMEQVDHAYQASVKEEKPYDIVHRIIRPDGEVRFVHEKSDDVMDENGEVIQSYGMVHDITERTLAEDELRQRESELNSIFRTAPTGIGVTVNRVFMNVNDRFCEMVGYSKEELLGKNARMIYPTQKEYEEVGQEHLRQLTKLGTGTIETRLQHKNGTIINVILNMTLQDPKNFSAGITFTFMDITTTKNAEKKLRRSEQKFRAMMESMSDPVYICSDDYHVEYMNPAMIKRTGRDASGEFCYKALHDFDQPCPWCKSKDELHGKFFESDIVSPKDNHAYHVSHSPIVNGDGSISNMTIFRDVTDLKRLESQLLQAQKMESIGTLAGGIAHDFNNILAAILGFSEMALLDLPDDSNAKKDIDQVIASGRRATDLVQQILTFSRKDPQKLNILSPHFIVEEALKMLHSSLPATVKIETDIDTECGKIQADPTQIHQVVMNLCTNAFQAMEDQKGTLRIELQRVEITAEEIAGKPETSVGPFVVLSISDSGRGMDQVTKDRIFEPYFTTKETGKGTGLGLAVIHGIVESYNGFIKVESEPGQGTTFHVYLPVLENNIVTPLSETEKVGSLPTGTEHIMVVDDEDAILNLHETVLKRLGYKVTSTTDSLVALEKIRIHPEQFDLIVTDQSMPNLSGAELAREVLKIKPTMPIILCTGYSSVVSEKDAMAIGIKKYTKKPVELKELARIVRQVLDES